MPQLVPFYFINQVTFAFILLIVMIYVFSKYILPRFAFILSLYSYISSELLVYNFFFTNYILPRFAFILSLYNYISSELLVYKFFFTNTPIKNLVTFLFSTHTSKKIFLFIQKKSQKDEIVTIPTKNDIFIFFSWCFYILFVPFFFINMYIFFGTIDIYSISLYNFFSLSFISFSLIYGLSIATLNSLLGNKYNIWKMLRSIMVYYSIFQLILLFLLIIICAFIIINSLIYLLGLSVPDLITWIWLRLSLLPSVIYSLNVLSCLYLKIFSSNNNIKLDFSPFSRNMVKAITFNRFLVCSIGVCSSYSFKSFLISFRCEVCEASLACGEEVSNFRVLISINDWWLGLQSAFKNGWLWLEFTFKKGCLWLQSIFNDLCLYIKNSFVAHCDSGDEDWSHFKDKKGRILKRSRSGSYNSSSGSYNSSSGGYNSEFDPSESNDSRSDSNSSRPTKRIKLEKSEDTIVVEPRIPVSGQSAPQQLAESSMVKAEKNLSNKPLSNKAINKTKSKIKSINKGKGKAKGKAIGQEEIVAHEYNTDFVNTNNGGFTSNENSDLESEEFQAALAESRAYEQRRIAGLQGGSIAESSRMGAMRNRSFRIAESQGGSIAESSRMGAMRNRSFRIAESSNTIESSRQEDIGSSGEKDVDDEWLPSKKGKSVKAKAKAKGKGKAPAIKSDSSGSDSADSDNSDSASNGPSSNKKIKLEESEDRKIKLEESEDTIVVQLPTEESEDTRVVEPRISVLGQSAQRQLSTTEANRARKAAYQRERRKNLKDSMTEEQKKAKNAEAAKAKERYKNMSEEQKQARKAKIAELKDSMSEEQKKVKNAAEAAKARERYKNMTEEQKQAKKAKNAAWVEKAKVSITEEEKAARVEKIKERRKSLKDSMSEEQKKAKNAAEAAKAKERYKNMSEEQKQAKKAKNAELKDSMSEEQKQAKNAAKAARAREWYKNRTEEQKATKKNSWEEWFKKRKLHMTEEEREASSSSSLQDSDSDRT